MYAHVARLQYDLFDIELQSRILTYSSINVRCTVSCCRAARVTVAAVAPRAAACCVRESTRTGERERMQENVLQMEPLQEVGPMPWLLVTVAKREKGFLVLRAD